MDFTNDGLNCLKCHHRHHENGNCVAVGGFCTAVPAAYCPLIPELLARAEATEAELKKKEEYYDQMIDALAALDSMELTEVKKKLEEAEGRAKNSESERDAIVTAINNGYRIGAITIRDPKFILPGIKIGPGITINGWYRTVKEE